MTEPVKPCLDTVVTFGAAHFYISQSDKGELVFGGDLDFYNSYAQRGNLPTIENFATALIALFPRYSRLRMMRNWGGVMDMTMDGSPIIGKTPMRRSLHRRRLVLWRLQGDAGLRLGLRPHHRQGRAAQVQRSLLARALCPWRVIDERGAGPTPTRISGTAP